MTSLGKPLVFYLKYMAEMTRLYADLEEGEERDLTGLEDAEHVVQMARTVGDAACEQVADFLALCGREVEVHFTAQGATLDAKTKRTFVVNNWSWRAHVKHPSVPGGWFALGVWVTAPPEIAVSLDKEACGEVVPWVWSKGGQKGEDALWNILGGWAHSRGAAGAGAEKGVVALACIPIKAQPPQSFDVDRDPLIAEVAKTVARIGSEQTKVIAKFVAGLKKTDDG